MQKLTNMTTKTKSKSKKNNKSEKHVSTKNSVQTRKFLEKLTGGRLTLGKAIRAIRECDEIKQTDFAKKLRVSQSYLCDLENSRKEVSPKKAAEFARILGQLETQFIRLALQDMFERQGLHFEVDVREAV